MANVHNMSRRPFGVAAFGTAVSMSIDARELEAAAVADEIAESLGPSQPVHVQPGRSPT